MGTIRTAAGVKLMTSLLTAEPSLLIEAKTALCRLFGPADLEGEVWPFDHTSYYAEEFGPHLIRQIVTFAHLIDPGHLPTVKRQTNELELVLGQSTEQDPAPGLAGCGHLQARRRRINIDPGYISLAKLVLASTKDHAHRLYLGQGIFGEVTLVYQDGAFRAQPWTYPDYASERYCTFFNEVRRRYRVQLRAEAQ